MTNRQWLLNKMQNMSDEELMETLEKIVDVWQYENTNYPCDSDCSPCKARWLKSEHKEPITLSEVERIILENIDKDFKWICRDKDNTLKLYIYKPKKHNGNWFADEATVCYRLECFNHLFQFITWKDSTPYNIAELLKGE